MTIEHYENFPVASWLCPPRLRPAVTAIYQFARTADDIADEGSASCAERIAQLADYGQALRRAANGKTDGPWRHVFEPMAAAIEHHKLPLDALTDLLSAFTQDAGNPSYPDRTALLHYCARSANPVGRLMLHLMGLTGREAAAESDAVCTALQLINFWQDLSVDLPRGRVYVPGADMLRAGLDAQKLRTGTDSGASRVLVRSLIDWARQTMQAGAPLVHRVPGRMGWELRLVVQGGLLVLDKIEAGGCNALSRRPTITRADGPRLVWRAIRMRPLAAVDARLPLPGDGRAG